jgi:hypothetical protein
VRSDGRDASSVYLVMMLRFMSGRWEGLNPRCGAENSRSAPEAGVNSGVIVTDYSYRTRTAEMELV